MYTSIQNNGHISTVCNFFSVLNHFREVVFWWNDKRLPWIHASVYSIVLTYTMSHCRFGIFSLYLLFQINLWCFVCLFPSIFPLATYLRFDQFCQYFLNFMSLCKSVSNNTKYFWKSHHGSFCKHPIVMKQLRIWK